MFSDIKKIEIELSSRCNAACPGCLRTILDSNEIFYEKSDLNIKVFKERFADVSLENVEVKLCGVLGDPLMHPQLVEFTRWLLQKMAIVEISTNGGLGKPDLWMALGELSQSTQRLRLMFSVDGLAETNAIYRKNTRYETIYRNMQIYSQAGGSGFWVFIGFDHNLHEKEEARQLALSFGFEFFVRRAIRNSFPTVIDKNQLQQAVAFVADSKHKKIDEAEKIENSQEADLDPQTVLCKFQHQGEVFISAVAEVWPCCFLWDEFNQPKSKFRDQMSWNVPRVGWNSLSEHSLEKILDSSFYKEIESRWVSGGDFFVKRCFKSCGEKGELQNSFSAN